MSNNEIKDKYGIEPIMKEMWVWDDDKTEVEKVLVLFNDRTYNRPYVCYSSDKEFCYYKYASETNPNDKEPKVGDKGYFWDNERGYYYGELNSIYCSDTKRYQCSALDMWFKNFSHDKQPWMK